MTFKCFHRTTDESHFFTAEVDAHRNLHRVCLQNRSECLDNERSLLGLIR
jgi:hypothetical protein